MTSNCRARVELVLEINISDNWGHATTVEQIHKQAIQSAEGKLREFLRTNARIIGNPKVIMIIVDNQ